MTDPTPPGRPSRRRTIATVTLALFYGLAGIAHLVVTDAMVRIVPPWVPQARLVVLATGWCELAGAVGLAIPPLRRPAALAFAAYAVCVYPANVQHAILDLSRGTGLGLWYHVPRLAAQPLLVAWAWWVARAWRGATSRPRSTR